LGKPWLIRINPQINWCTNILYYSHNNTTVKWTCTGHQSNNI
jgi:hypothetical protein